MKYFLLIVISITTLILYSQDNESSKGKNLKFDEDMSSINFELLSVSYCPTLILKPKLAFGVEMQGGLGLKILLNNPSYKYTDDMSPSWTYNNVEKLIEILKIEPFITYILSNSTFMNFGIFGSLNQIGYEHPSKIDFNLGVEYSVFYGLEKIKIGHRFQFGYLFIRYSNNTEANSNVFNLLFTPIALKIKL